MSLWKQPLSKLYGGLAYAHHRLYDTGLRSRVRLCVPVISVGNLTVGGTGKTPLTDFILSWAQAQGLKPGLVVRSYKASATTAHRVSAEEGDPAVSGDEAVWFARKHPSIPVYSGPVKSDSADLLARDEKVDFVLVDDGYQHRRLQRDLDLLVIDATEKIENYVVLPIGRAREPWAGIRRAGAVLITKTNLAPPEQLELLRGKIRKAGKPFFEFDYSMPMPEEWRSPWLLVCGVARPETVRQAVLREGGPVDVNLCVFEDHHAYTPADVELILERGRRLGSREIVTTEKDAVKLNSLWPAQPPLRVLKLELRPQSPLEELYVLLRSAVR